LVAWLRRVAADVSEDALTIRFTKLGRCRERATRIELAFSAWEADVLPLNYARWSVVECS
jgi:hypothetical protein